MKHPFSILLLAFTLAGCEKDPVITDVPADSLPVYLEDFPTEKRSNRVWVQAGNHLSFERETDGLPIHVIFHVPDSAHSFTYFESDSTRFPDSLQFFRKKAVTFELMENQLLGRFLCKTPK